MKNIKNLIASKRRYYSYTEEIRDTDGNLIAIKTTFPNLKF